MPRFGDRTPLAERFWAKVNKYPAGCWHWIGAKNADGYGCIGAGGRNGGMLGAHRVAWFLAAGEYPKEHVLHTCDNRACVNPAHLFLGTHQDNMDDCRKKGRKARGEKAASAKLTTADILEIRRRGADGESQSEIALDYPVSPRQIGAIIRREKWAHV